jgi:hypothetical protein
MDGASGFGVKSCMKEALWIRQRGAYKKVELDLILTCWLLRCAIATVDD